MIAALIAKLFRRHPPPAADASRDDSIVAWLRGLANVQETDAGVIVDESTALQVAAVFGCVRLISEALAACPCGIYRPAGNGMSGGIPATEHPLWRILRQGPNPEDTAVDFWTTLLSNLLIYGRAYARIERAGDGQIRSLTVIPTVKVRSPQRNSVTEELYWDITLDGGGTERVYPEGLLHVEWLRLASREQPLYPISVAQQVIGLAQALDRHAAGYFASGATPSGIVEYPGVLNDERLQRLRESFSEAYAGLRRAHRLIFLEGGSKFTPVTIDPDKSQSLESRRNQVAEICRYYGVPPTLLYELDRATYHNTEQLDIQLVKYCLAPHARRLEQAIWRDLITERERQAGLFVKFNLNALLRGDVNSRREYYAAGIRNGWLTPADVRELEDLNPYPEGVGANEPYVSRDLVPIRQASRGVEVIS